MDVSWHFRLGHVPFSKMKHTPVLSSYLYSKQSFPFFICPLARQNILYFPGCIIYYTIPFQHIHINTWDPYHSSTSTGARYFLTVVDDYSIATWTHLLGAKSNVFDMLKSFIVMVENHFHTNIKSVRSDNVLELGSSSIKSKFFSEKRYHSLDFMSTHTSAKWYCEKEAQISP